MHSINAAAALLAFASMANASFYIMHGFQSTPPVCVGVTGCIPEPVTSYLDYIMLTTDFNCKYLQSLSNDGTSNMGDPVCGNGPKSFTLPTTKKRTVCGGHTSLHFRIDPSNSGLLQAATDSNYNNVVASCRKNPNCKQLDSLACGTDKTDEYEARFLCTAVNGSTC